MSDDINETIVDPLTDSFKQIDTHRNHGYLSQEELAAAEVNRNLSE